MQENLTRNEIPPPTAQWRAGKRPETISQRPFHQPLILMRFLLYPLPLRMEGKAIRGDKKEAKKKKQTKNKLEKKPWGQGFFERT